MSQVADRYAKAVFELAQEQNNLESVHQTFEEMSSLMQNQEAFREFLSNPLLSFEERSGILKALFEGKISPLAFQFFVFLAYKNRLNIVKDIMGSFDHLYITSKNEIRAVVETALPLNDQDKSFINQKLNDKFHHNVLTEWTLQPSILGGFRIYAEGKIYDYSFTGQLERFKQKVLL